MIERRKIPRFPMNGTPEDLQQAIINGLNVSINNEIIINNLKLHIIDYLSQHFGAAMLEASHGQQDTNSLKALIKLWEGIKNEKKEAA